MKTYIAWLLCLVLLLGTVGCSSADVPDLQEPVGVRVDTAVVQRGEIFQLASYEGDIVPHVEALQFVIDGRLESFRVTLGQEVKKGDVLAALDEEKLAEQAESLQEQIDHVTTLGEFSDRQAEASLEAARQELARLELQQRDQYLRLQKENDIARLEAQLRQAQELRQLQLDELQRQLDELTVQMELNEITAPFDGTVIFVADIGNGDAVQGYTTVICLADETRLSLQTEYIRDYQIDGASRIYARILDTDYAVDHVPWDPSEYIVMVLSGEEVKTKFSVPSGEGLEAGMDAILMIESMRREDVLTVPVNALYRDERGRYVYKMDGERRIRCDVTVGTVSDTRAEIVEGLEEGDVVYVKG